jgi:hypothetical protein
VRKLESKVGVLQIGYNKYWMQNASMMLSSPLLIELIYTRASIIFQPQSNETTNPPIHQSTNPPIHQPNPRSIALFSKDKGKSNAAIRSQLMKEENWGVSIRALWKNIIP